MTELFKNNDFILPSLIFIGAFLAGVVVKRIVFGNLRKVVSKTKWQSDDIIINSIGDFIVTWSVLAGAYFAIRKIGLDSNDFILVKKVLLALFILSTTYVAAKMAGGFIALYMRKNKGVLPSSSIFVNLTKLLVFIIGGLTLLQSLGISITPILTALGVGGLAVALALQETLSNLFSGIHILASRQIKPGDYVRLDTGEEGYVTDTSWRNTTIKTLGNNTIIIPNTKLATIIITNFNFPKQEMSVLIQVGVSYDSDLEKVEEVTIDVAREVMEKVKGGVTDFDPFIRFHTFGESSIDFTVILRTEEFSDQYIIKHEFVKRLHKRFNEEGIEIPFPQRVLHTYSKDDIESLMVADTQETGV